MFTGRYGDWNVKINASAVFLVRAQEDWISPLGKKGLKPIRVYFKADQRRFELRLREKFGINFTMIRPFFKQAKMSQLFEYQLTRAQSFSGRVDG